MHKGACFGAKQTGSGSPTTSSLDEALKAKDEALKANAKFRARIEALEAIVQAKDCPAPSPDEDVVVIEDDSATAKVSALRDQIKMVNSLPDNDTFTAIHKQTKAQMLAELEKQMQDARAAVRDSKPLATQQMQVEAFLRKLNIGAL